MVRKRTRERERNRTRLRTLRRFNMDEEEYEHWLGAQNGKCAICREPPTTRLRLAIDHCHKTMTVRGLLCRKCNVGLGMFRDNPKFLTAAIEYLKESL